MKKQNAHSHVYFPPNWRDVNQYTLLISNKISDFSLTLSCFSLSIFAILGYPISHFLK